MGNPDYKQSSRGTHVSLLAWKPRNLGSKLPIDLGYIWQVDSDQIIEDLDV